MLLTGHKSRAIFDRYNIIHEQELLDAGDQLVSYLEQHAQAMPRGRAHPTDATATRTVARVRFRRSDAKRLRLAASAAHSPLSWASDRATMCSMSVSRGLGSRGSRALEPERVVQLGAPALAQRRETLVELIRSQILPVLGVDQVEVVPGRIHRVLRKSPMISETSSYWTLPVTEDHGLISQAVFRRNRFVSKAP